MILPVGGNSVTPFVGGVGVAVRAGTVVGVLVGTRVGVLVGRPPPTPGGGVAVGVFVG